MRRWVLRLALLAGGTVIAVGVLEVALRLLGISYPAFHTWDRHRGSALRPGASGWYREEGEAHVRVNSAGMRDREHAREKPPGTLRIAVLGDSFTEALQVPRDATFWAVLERELGRCLAPSGRTVEVLNFGVSGYGTAQELLTLRHRVWEFRPDLVLLAFLSGNDVSDNSRALEGDPMKPYFVYRDGELVLDDSFRDQSAFRARQTPLAELVYRLLDHSRTLQVVIRAQRNLRAAAQHRQRQAATPETPVGEELGLESAVYAEPADVRWREAWQVTEGLLALMRDEVESHDVELLVVSLSNPIQVHPDPGLRRAFAERLGVQDLFYPERRLASWGEAHGVAVLPLAPRLQPIAERRGVFLHGFGDALGEGHWNELGHRLAGELIARHLCRARSGRGYTEPTAPHDPAPHSPPSAEHSAHERRH
ncbi:MAG TPA: SGNH/GDSL hydrolase family protein [Thermoanaerobaculia bacterium]|nr:SGNH/GDSL hydrolase family protein [Thermoanaerobaculia bacterium]